MPLLEPGIAAPEIEGENLTGSPVSLADSRGKRAVVLIFSPRNVDPMRINETKLMHQRLREKVDLVAVMGAVPSKQMARMFLQQMGVQFPVLLDEPNAVFKAYGVEKPPAVFYINIEGQIVAAGTEGGIPDIEAGVRKYLL